MNPISLAQKVKNAYIARYNAQSDLRRIRDRQNVMNSENVYFRRLVRAGNRPWTKSISNNVNNAKRNKNAATRNAEKKHQEANARLQRALTAAQEVFGPEWTNYQNFIKILRIANSRARRTVRKSMGSTMSVAANARRRQRNLIGHELSYYTMGKNNNNNRTIRPSNVRRSAIGGNTKRRKVSNN
jgi:hypothetical protein